MSRRDLPQDVASWTDADRASYLADDIEHNGIEDATSCFDPWEASIYVRALRAFAAAEDAKNA